MFKVFRRLLGGGFRAGAGEKGALVAEIASEFDSNENDWIEPAITIAESELDLADLPEDCGWHPSYVAEDFVPCSLQCPGGWCACYERWLLWKGDEGGR